MFNCLSSPYQYRSVVSFFPCWVRWAGLLGPFPLLGTVGWSVGSFSLAGYGGLVCCVLSSLLGTVGWSVVSFFMLVGYGGLACCVLLSSLGTVGWSVVSLFPCWVRWAGLLCPFFLAWYDGLVCCVPFSLLGTVGWSVVSFFPCWVRWAGLLCLTGAVRLLHRV